MSIFSSFKPNELASFVRAITKQEITNSEQKFEQVLMGTIKSVDSNKYTVALKDTESEVEAVALNGTDVFSKEDSVYLLRCTFDNNTNYLILNTVAVTEEIYFNLPLENRFISSTEIKDYRNVATIKANGVLKVEATFSANGTIENYGLEIKLLDSNDNILITYYLDTNYFEGQPYSLSESLQSRVIYIEDKDILNNLHKVAITEFPASSYHVKDDSIKLYSGTIVEADPSLHAEAAVVGNKNYFNKIIVGQEDSEIIKVSADLFHNSTRLQKSTIQYYWLLKNEDIKENQIGEKINAYLAIVGSGWECLNNFEVLSVLGGGSYRNWNTTQQTLELNSSYRDKLNKFRNILKCLIVYGDNYLYSKEFEILNYEHEEFYANVIKDQESDYLEDFATASMTLQCEVLDHNPKADFKGYSLFYQWYSGDTLLENKNANNLIVYRSENTNTSYNNNEFIMLDNNLATFSCEVTIKKGEDIVSTERSNIVTIVPIVKGIQGKDGKDGTSVSSIVNYYVASKNSSGVTVAGGLEQDESWTTSPQTPSKDKQYLWNYELITYSDGNTTSTSPTIIGYWSKDGEDGKGINSISEYYYLATTASQINTPNEETLDSAVGAPASPSAGVWYKTCPITDTTNRYLWNCEKIVYTDNTIHITTPGLTGVHGATGPQGIQGPIGPSGKSIQQQEELFGCSDSSANAHTIFKTEANFFGSSLDIDRKDNQLPWNSKYMINTYPFVWKRIKTTYSDGSEELSNPLLLSDLEAATLAAAAQIQDKGDYSSIVGAWCAAVGKTIVDGSTIMTGTVGADQIKVNSLDALTANMGSLTAGEIKSPGYGDIKVWNGEESWEVEGYSKGLEYQINKDGTGYKIRSAGTCTDKDLRIPPIYKGLPVTGTVGSGGIFLKIKDILERVVIPNTFSNIPIAFLAECSNLKEVVIPDSITSIGDSAFYNCSNLTSVVIPSGVTSIGSSAFYNCSNLTIYCEAESQPSGWNSNWNSSGCTVYWYSENKPSSEGNYWHYGDAGHGFKISCDDENMIDSKYFAVTKNGEVTASKGDIAGWDIGENGIFRESSQEGYDLIYGLNSDTNFKANSLIDGSSQMVIFYCKKKQNNGEIITEEYPFMLLEDGSLYSTAAQFSGNKVILGDDIILGTSAEATVDLSRLMSTFGVRRGSSLKDTVTAIQTPVENFEIAEIILADTSEVGFAEGGTVTLNGIAFQFYDVYPAAAHNRDDYNAITPSTPGSPKSWQADGEKDSSHGPVFYYNFEALAFVIDPATWSEVGISGGDTIVKVGLEFSQDISEKLSEQFLSNTQAYIGFADGYGNDSLDGGGAEVEIDGNSLIVTLPSPSEVIDNSNINILLIFNNGNNIGSSFSVRNYIKLYYIVRENNSTEEE